MEATQNSLNSGLDVAGLVIFGIFPAAGAGEHGRLVSSKNGDAVPGTLALQTAS